MPIAAWQGALVSKHVRRACSSGIVILHVKGIIGRSIRKYANNGPLNYATRRCSRTRRPAKEDGPICFLPMPTKLISCMTLSPATILSVPIYDYEVTNEELATIATEVYYSCCEKSICGGCIYSFKQSGNIGICPFCNARTGGKTNEERVGELMKRVEVNDAGAIYVLGNYYYHGKQGLLRDQERAMELWKQAADLGYSKAHYQLGCIYDAEGNSKKEKFHLGAAAMAGDEATRYNLGCMEAQSGNVERAVKHWTIAASAGSHLAMHSLLIEFEKGSVSRDEIDSTLTDYNNSCAEMRSEARDACIRSRSN